MNKDNFDEFSQLLDAAYDLLGSGANKVVSSVAKSLFFSTMEPYPIQAVRAALNEHCRRGKFVPRPADLIEQIEGLAAQDGRPSEEEAWAMVPLDENRSTCWTAEMAEAWGIAGSLIADGDRVAARMAFKEVYARLVSQARAQKTPIRWCMSLGTDKLGRQEAIVDAVRRERLPLDSAIALLPPDAAESVLMALDVKSHPLLVGPSDAGRTHLKALMLSLKGNK